MGAGPNSGVHVLLLMVCSFPNGPCVSDVRSGTDSVMFSCCCMGLLSLWLLVVLLL
jgi:hypothetical protein